MGRTARVITEEGVYHVMQRGAGKQILFEDDDDRYRYLGYLNESLKQDGIALIAWCLMSNHVHLLIDDPNKNMPHALHRLATSYAGYYKNKTGLTGPVFQGRYNSIPIHSNEQLLQAVRYIHDNPIKAGIGTLSSYRWSSFAEYLNGQACRCNPAMVKTLFKSTDDFYRFSISDLPNPYYFKTGRAIEEQDFREVASAAIYPVRLVQVKSMERDQRNAMLRKIRDAGLTFNQIELATGVGIGSIRGACKE